ncbi:MAG: N-acetylmuramoyl-L-alanine amidase [candidate division Zixibacteria bacterium]|nr:N-acetylmuramoyl-L-alanine amidase [candidate division Zixibacteria bacterium]
MKKYAFLLAAMLFFVPLQAEELLIKVVYPETMQVLPPIDSNFIFGSVTPGAKLTINGTPVEVYKTGGFLAFLPVAEGNFYYRLKAEKNGQKVAFDWPVLVTPKPRPIPRDSLAIRFGSATPSDSIFTYPGELVTLSFSGTPGLSAFFTVEGLEGEFPMVETALPSGNSNRRNGGNNFVIPEMLPESTGSGFYTGVLRVPDKRLSASKITVYLTKSDTGCVVPEKKVRFAPPIVGGASVSRCVAETLRAMLTVWDPAVPRVVELDDSVSVLRSAPNAGYVAIFQPQGIRAYLTARIGRYVKLKLAETQSVWAPDTLVSFLPPGSVIPPGSVSYIRTTDSTKWVKITFTASRKMAFRVEEDPVLARLSIFIFGAVTRADWIRYDNAADLVKNIRWSQPESDIFRADVDLNSKALWGYDAFFEGNNLVLLVKKPPAQKAWFKGLTIAVDAGHTNTPTETGAKGPTGLEEREANLWIALELAKILEKRGAKVVMTRKGMESVGLYDRPQIAKGAEADLFVSIHNNAHPDGTNPFLVNGTSVYYYHVHSQDLARSVQRRLLKATGLKDLGLYFGNFVVIRPPQYPAILCEIAFMMIPRQEEMLRSKPFHKKAAAAIAEGIADYLRASTKK